MIVQKRLWIRLIFIVFPQTNKHLKCQKFGNSHSGERIEIESLVVIKIYQLVSN